MPRPRLYPELSTVVKKVDSAAPHQQKQLFERYVAFGGTMPFGTFRQRLLKEFGTPPNDNGSYNFTFEKA
jgi:hypothetical protein